MTQFKNMKFKVASPEQSERVINVLQKMGYRLFGDLDISNFVDSPFLYSYADSDIASGQEHAHTISHELQDTAAFLAAHEPAPAPTLVSHPDDLGWFDNTGTMPDLPKGTLIDVLYLNCNGSGQSEVEHFDWSLGEGAYTIAKWRFHRPEDAASYFVQPKTASRDFMTGREVKPLYSDDVLKPVKSDGLSTSYYDLVIRTKAGTFNCKVGDVIDAMVGNDFDLGNAIKAIRRIYEHVQGRGKDGVDAEYDKNKVNYFVNEFIERSKLK